MHEYCLVLRPSDASHTPEPPKVNPLRKLFRHLEEPVDGASVAFLRIAFAAVMLFWLGMHIALDKIGANYYEPSFLFPYTGFEWVTSLASEGRWLYVHFLIVFLAAAGMLLGVFYRFSSIVFAIGFSLIFLLDKATYQNHYYFVCLLSMLLVVCPVHRAISFDRLRLKAEGSFVPRWSVWILRFQIGLVYFFGGIAKMNADWVSGFPMRHVLQAKQDHPVIGAFCDQEWFVYSFVWSGLLFDLLIVGLLLFRRTRLLGFGFCLIFHLLNASLFRIGIFPWLMILATTIFFPPAWPRKIFSSLLPAAEPRSSTAPQKSLARLALFGFLGLFVALQILIPLRHFLYNENTSWTERNHHFAWHMKLRGKTTAIRFYTRNPANGQWAKFKLEEHLKLHQLMRMTRDPWMIRDFALFIEDYYQRAGIPDVEVRVFSLCSLNGRKPELLIDPDVDLTADLPPDWIVPLQATIGGDFYEPLDKWERLVMNDPILAEIATEQKQQSKTN